MRGAGGGGGSTNLLLGTRFRAGLLGVPPSPVAFPVAGLPPPGGGGGGGGGVKDPRWGEASRVLLLCCSAFEGEKCALPPAPLPPLPPLPPPLLPPPTPEPPPPLLLCSPLLGPLVDPLPPLSPEATADTVPALPLVLRMGDAGSTMSLIVTLAREEV